MANVSLTKRILYATLTYLLFFVPVLSAYTADGYHASVWGKSKANNLPKLSRGTSRKLIEDSVTKKPTKKPQKSPTKKPTKKPQKSPTKKPTKKPHKPPTKKPTTKPQKPTKKPNKPPTTKPTTKPTVKPTTKPAPKPTPTPKTTPTPVPKQNPEPGPKSPTSTPSQEKMGPPTGTPASYDYGLSNYIANLHN